MRQPFRLRDGTACAAGALMDILAEHEMADEQPIHETAVEARAGTGPGVMRYVLIASLVLVVAALGGVVAIGWMG